MQSTGSAIDTDPAKFGYTFGGFDKLRQEGDNPNVTRAWRNKHGLRYGQVTRFAHKSNQEFNPEKVGKKYIVSPYTE